MFTVTQNSLRTRMAALTALLNSKDSQSQFILSKVPNIAAITSIELIYRASRDGWTPERFHSLCDGRGETITIIKSSKNYLSGGYTSKPWRSSGGYIKDENAFLFQLTNSQAIYKPGNVN